MGYPDTEEKRRAGMASFRARLLAAHSRLANDPRLTAKQRTDQQKIAEMVRRSQIKHADKAA